MLRVDEAERRGDAIGALELMQAMPDGPDGKPYWRPWRANRLFQLVLFDPYLPRWATSRWILEQALQDLDERRRGQVSEALRIAIELRGGVDRLPGKDRLDARTRVMDHDWVFRECLLYELGGLEHFVRKRATADLVAGADRIHDWARTPMGGYRYLGRDPAATPWEDLATGEVIVTPNIGSAVLMLPGECAIGRLVPIEEGRMFETLPLLAPEAVAARVASDPDSWIDALREAASAEPIRTGPFTFGFLSDVPPTVSMLALYDDSLGKVPSEADFARGWLRAVSRALTELDEGACDDPEMVDVWPCLAEAVLSPSTFGGLADILGPADAELLARLGEILAEPAGTICRGMAAELRPAA